MDITKPPRVVPTHRHWSTRLRELASDTWQAWCEGTPHAQLQALDRRTLADLGLDASEASSVQAEARRDADLTRLRIVAHGLRRA